MSVGISTLLWLLAAIETPVAENPIASEGEPLDAIQLLQCLSGEDPVSSCKSPTLVSCSDAAGSSFSSMRTCLLNETIIVDSLIESTLKQQSHCYQNSGRTAGEAYSIEQSIATEQRTWEAYRQAAISSELAFNHDGAFQKSQGFLEAAAVALNLSRERVRKIIGETGARCR